MAAIPPRQPGIAVLELHHASHGRIGKQAIQPNDKFDLGRSGIQRIWNTEEPTISTHHLRFHCVVFEQGDDEEAQYVAPLVYVQVLSCNGVGLQRADYNNLSGDVVLSRGSGDVLLNHDDVLQLTLSISLHFKFQGQKAGHDGGLDRIRRREITHFAKQYAISDRILGTGGNASVFVAVKHSTKRQFACKIVRLPSQHPDISHLDQRSRAEHRERELDLLEKRNKLAREYDVLKDLNHANIISLEKVFCTTYNIYIIQELITGGDLLSYIEQIGSVSEPESAMIVRQVLKAVEYLHSNQIVHRDIKPENVLVTAWRTGARVVLTDFGQSRDLQESKSAKGSATSFRMQSVVGTHGYTAPEVYKAARHEQQQNEGYSKAIDIWSVGCIAGTLLTGEPMPFEDDDYDNSEWHLEFMEHGHWRGIGKKAKSFTRSCLHIDESLRLTAKQALLHDWFTNKHYAAELEAAYQRAIEDWKPRVNEGSLIEFIDTSDTVAADSKAQHVKRLVQETRSRHFAPNEKAAASQSSVMVMKPVHLPPPTKRHTPLPAIAEESDPEHSSPLTRTNTNGQLFASPVCVPNTPSRALQRAVSGSYATRSDIEDLADTGMPLTDSMPLVLTDEWRDSPAITQTMLDEASPPKYDLSDSFAEPLTYQESSKRAASVAVEMTQYSGDLDVPSYPLPQRKKIKR